MLQQSIERQGIILNETYQYLHRDFRKYIKGAVGMWILFGTDCETGDAYRSCYYFFRHVDDVLDNDRVVQEDPFTYVGNLRDSIQTNNFTEYPILSLASRSIDYLERVKRNDDDPKKDMLQLIDSMVYDRKRMLSREVLDKEKLIENYHAQFDPIINLQLISLRSGLRVKDIPYFPEVQARVYSLIDLESDWNKGLINIPSEVLETAGLNSMAYIPMLETSPVIQNWMQSEQAECAVQLGETKHVLSEYFSQYGNKRSMPRTERIQQVVLTQLLNKIEGHISRN